jgi:hypothetical protein
MRNITARITTTPVAIAVQPTTDGEKVPVVMLLLKLVDVWIKFVLGWIAAPFNKCTSSPIPSS